MTSYVILDADGIVGGRKIFSLSCMWILKHTFEQTYTFCHERTHNTAVLNF